MGELRLQRRAQHVLGADHVRLVHRPVLRLGDPDLVHRRAVDRRVATLHPGADGVLVREGAGDELAAELGERGALLGAADERPHLVAPLAQLAEPRGRR